MSQHAETRTNVKDVAAFCFYNLSSIVNGLVYFDQFSLIPPLYLGLVTLGIFVLLCGVWIVSIQSGGGGVDVGTWNEEGIILSEEDVALYSEPEDTQPREAVAMMRQQAPNQAKVQTGPVPMERETRSESSLPNIPPSDTIGLGLNAGGGADTRLSQSTISTTKGKRQRAETQLYGGPRMPSHRSRRSPMVDFNEPASSSQLPHARTVSYPHPGHPHHAPLSPPHGHVPTLSTGFQIGLSPLSPGFTIAPRERRRRPSGFGIVGPSFADVANDVVRARRRTVSEGEVTSQLRNVRDETTGDGSLDSERAKQHWTWLRSVFTRKD